MRNTTKWRLNPTSTPPLLSISYIPSSPPIHLLHPLLPSYPSLTSLPPLLPNLSPFSQWQHLLLKPSSSSSSWSFISVQSVDWTVDDKYLGMLCLCPERGLDSGWQVPWHVVSVSRAWIGQWMTSTLACCVCVQSVDWTVDDKYLGMLYLCPERGLDSGWQVPWHVVSVSRSWIGQWMKSTLAVQNRCLSTAVPWACFHSNTSRTPSRCCGKDLHSVKVTLRVYCGQVTISNLHNVKATLRVCGKDLDSVKVTLRVCGKDLDSVKVTLRVCGKDLDNAKATLRVCDFHSVKVTLRVCDKDLHSVKVTLRVCGKDLDSVKVTLRVCGKDLDSVKVTLRVCGKDLDSVKVTLRVCGKDLDSVKVTLRVCGKDLDSVKVTLRVCGKDLDSVKVTLRVCGKELVLRSPLGSVVKT